VPEAVDLFNICQGVMTTILPNDSLQVMADVHFYIDGLIPITHVGPIQFEGGEWFHSDNCNCIVGDDEGATICRISGMFLDIKKRAEEDFIASNQSKKLVSVTVPFII
jgi:hypothetical protein